MENRKAPFDLRLGKILEKRFSFTFETPESGIYFTEITASAKNKKQNIYPHWAWRIPLLPVRSVVGKDDDDLYLKIDNREFPKLGGIRGLHNAPAAWSGTSPTAYRNNFFLSQRYPPPEPLDPNLVKAIIYRESRLGYYPDEDITDVMQVWGNQTPETLREEPGYPANEFITPERIGHMSYSYPPDRIPPKVETPEESIFWGVRWLYHKAQYLETDEAEKLVKPYVRKWLSGRKAVWNYNANRKLVEDYVNEVFSVYEKGVDLKGNVLWEK